MSIAKKLQTVCNQMYGVRLLINSKQWFSDDKNRAITQYTIIQTKKEDGKTSNVTLFRTYSQVQLVLFMRDYWYTLNGWEVPQDNEVWEEAKRQYATQENNAAD